MDLRHCDYLYYLTVDCRKGDLMEKPKDDLDAVRIVVQTLESFDKDERERIFRWAAEKLGMPLASRQSTSSVTALHQPHRKEVTGHAAPPQTDLKSFVAEKDPKSDVHFAATVAYYYQFEAPQDQRKDAISRDDLVQAVRVVNRDRLRNPGQTLNNAYHLGLFDKTGERGVYGLNTVGENLVAVILPDGGSLIQTTRPAKRTKKAKRRKKATVKVKSAKSKTKQKKADKK
jgi:hypothetical protein